MVYVYEPPPHKLVIVPVIVPGCANTDLTVTNLATLSPQVLDAFTDTAPETNGVGNRTVILLVPAPANIVAPVGTVQLYPVAPVVEAVHVYV